MHSIAGFAENSLANCVKNHAFRQMPDLYQDYMGLSSRMIDFKKMLINSQVLISPDSSIFLPKSNLYVFLKKKLNKLDLFFYRKTKCHFVVPIAILLKKCTFLHMMHQIDRQN